MSAWDFVFCWAACCILTAVFILGAFLEDRK